MASLRSSEMPGRVDTLMVNEPSLKRAAGKPRPSEKNMPKATAKSRAVAPSMSLG